MNQMYRQMLSMLYFLSNNGTMEQCNKTDAETVIAAKIMSVKQWICAHSTLNLNTVHPFLLQQEV